MSVVGEYLQTLFRSGGRADAYSDETPYRFLAGLFNKHRTDSPGSAGVTVEDMRAWSQGTDVSAVSGALNAWITSPSFVHSVARSVGHIAWIDPEAHGSVLRVLQNTTHELQLVEDSMRALAEGLCAGGVPRAGGADDVQRLPLVSAVSAGRAGGLPRAGGADAVQLPALVSAVSAGRSFLSDRTFFIAAMDNVYLALASCEHDRDRNDLLTALMAQLADIRHIPRAVLLTAYQAGMAIGGSSALEPFVRNAVQGAIVAELSRDPATLIICGSGCTSHALRTLQLVELSARRTGGAKSWYDGLSTCYALDFVTAPRTIHVDDGLTFIACSTLMQSYGEPTAALNDGDYSGALLLFENCTYGRECRTAINMGTFALSKGTILVIFAQHTKMMRQHGKAPQMIIVAEHFQQSSQHDVVVTHVLAEGQDCTGDSAAEEGLGEEDGESVLIVVCVTLRVAATAAAAGAAAKNPSGGGGGL